MMDKILKSVNALSGVAGSFVCDEEGQVWASALPSHFNEATLSAVSRNVAQTVTGLRFASGDRVGDIDLLFSAGRFIIKNQEEACLCILSEPNINVALLNQTSDAVIGKLSTKIREQRKKVGPELEKIVSAYPDLVGPVKDFDKTVEGEEGRRAMNDLGQSVGGRIFQQEYAGKSTLTSLKDGLQTVVLPSVNLFSIAKAGKDRIDVMGCPFCQGKETSVANCDFLSGYINGMLDEMPAFAGAEVTETDCKAKGDETCTFMVVEKER